MLKKQHFKCIKRIYPQQIKSVNGRFRCLKGLKKLMSALFH